MVLKLLAVLSGIVVVVFLLLYWLGYLRPHAPTPKAIIAMSHENECFFVDMENADISDAVAACAKGSRLRICLEALPLDRTKDRITAEMFLNGRGQVIPDQREKADFQKLDPKTVVEWKRPRASIHFDNLPILELPQGFMQAYPAFSAEFYDASMVVRPKRGSHLDFTIPQFDAHELSLKDVIQKMIPLFKSSGVEFFPLNFEGSAVAQRENAFYAVTISDIHVQNIAAWQLLTRVVEAAGDRYSWVTQSFTGEKCWWTIREYQ